MAPASHVVAHVDVLNSWAIQPREAWKASVNVQAGDPYVEPAKYHLRGNSTAEKPFVNMHGNRTVAKSEFIHMHNGKPKVVTPERAKGLHIK